jgi:hypothetical protein
MANEATIISQLQVVKGNRQYTSLPNTFRATVTGSGGPTPGDVEIAVEGTDIDFSAITTPGLCRMLNTDSTNFVTYGIWDGVSFYPLGEILPGETYVLRLSRNLGEEYGVGTGTSGAAINTLRFKADTDPVRVTVEAFEK